MKSHVRAVTAYVAGRLITGVNSWSVYDYAAGEEISMAGTVNNTSVSVYDHKNRCFFQGGGQNGKFSLFHCGENAYVSLEVSDNRLQGLDYGSLCHFSGTVRGTSITLCDYAEGLQFNYSI